VWKNLKKNRVAPQKKWVNHCGADKKDAGIRSSLAFLVVAVGTWKLLPQCRCIGACASVLCVCVSEPIKCFFVSRCVCEGAKFQKQPPKSFFRCQTVYFARHSKWDASFESVNAVSSFTFNGGPCGVYLIQAATREERLNPCQPLI